ncbi:hypothetical protein BDY19DRAFT_902108 [Irpex rosettiformis]|uniref:Uncharacterized protein n=1 Tax=Irpex rosettiformis TaxID=378272 RepID=A0ACB8ULJ5_9APHY|nr:hypothetical protein BDY19DRAFT_902108 [Irpex rosettiformis]
MSAPMVRSVSTSSTETVSPSIPFVRRRMSGEQVQALHKLYETKSHPSKQQRADLARELNLELKVVNVWFQNKRRSMKKKSIAWNRATALMSENAFGMGKSRFSTLANPSKQKSLIRRDSSLSLDSIAASREKKEALTYPRPPFTPRKNTLRNTTTFNPQWMQNKDAIDDKPYLWDLLPSSPQLPPSSPTKETDLLSALPPQSKTMKSLEWACAKDRVGRRKKTQQVLYDVGEEDDPDIPELVLDSVGGDDTDIDDDMITPDNSMSMSFLPRRQRTSSLDSKTSISGEDTPDEDVEAAIVLLKFKVRNS